MLLQFDNTFILMPYYLLVCPQTTARVELHHTDDIVYVMSIIIGSILYISHVSSTNFSAFVQNNDVCDHDNKNNDKSNYYLMKYSTQCVNETANHSSKMFYRIKLN